MAMATAPGAAGSGARRARAGGRPARRQAGPARSFSISAPLSARDAARASLDDGEEYVSDYTLCARFAHETKAKNPEQRILVFPLRADDAEPAAQILCRAFAGGPYGKPITFVRRYLLDQTGAMPNSTTLTAWLLPDDFDDPVTSTEAVTEESGCKLVGMADVSIDEKSRADFENTGVDVPEHATYLSNVAVDEKQRRRGIGAALVAAAEDLAVELGYGQMALHVRQGDVPAESLYQSIGYCTVATERAGVGLNRVPRELLMHELDLLGGLFDE